MQMQKHLRSHWRSVTMKQMVMQRRRQRHWRWATEMQTQKHLLTQTLILMHLH